VNPFVSPLINATDYRAEYKSSGFVQIDNFLDTSVAEAIYDALNRDTPFDQVYWDSADNRVVKIADHDWKALSQEQKNSITQPLQPSDEFGFWYENFSMISAYQEQRHKHSILHKVLESLNSPEYHGLMKSITGLPNFKLLDAQATRYRANHFLTKHSDQNEQHLRHAAYVLSFSKNWCEDNGGSLDFFDEQGQRTRRCFPRFNTLTLFSVPQVHEVVKVDSSCLDDRLSITGWIRSR